LKSVTLALDCLAIEGLPSMVGRIDFWLDSNVAHAVC
jgi:hypothetical protein